MTTHTRLLNDTALRTALGTLDELRPLLRPDAERAVLAAV